MINNKNIVWYNTSRRPPVLRAMAITESDQLEIWITEDDMEQVANWCQANDCGRRTSYDMFSFRNNTEVTMFLLRWS